MQYIIWALPVLIVALICIFAMFATIWRQHFGKCMSVVCYILAGLCLFAMFKTAEEYREPDDTIIDRIANSLLDGNHWLLIFSGALVVIGAVIWMKSSYKPYYPPPRSTVSRTYEPERKYTYEPAPEAPAPDAERVAAAELKEKLNGLAADSAKLFIEKLIKFVRFVFEKLSHIDWKAIDFKDLLIGEKEMNYQDIYIKKFRMLPHYYYISTLVGVFVLGLIEIIIFSDFLSDSYAGLFSFIVGSEDYISGILALIIWGVIAFLVARYVRWITSIILSQKIVVADSLLMMSAEDSSAPAPTSGPAPAPAPAPARTYTPPAAAAPQATPAPQAAPAYATPAPAPQAAPASAAPASNAQRYFYSGHNADLSVYDTRIVITGKGYNKSIGEKTIPMKSISAVQFKASSAAVNGYITFNVLGEVASSQGGIGGGAKQRISENTVVFKSGRDDAKVKEIKEFVEGIIYGAPVEAPAPQPAPEPQPVAEEKPAAKSRSKSSKKESADNNSTAEEKNDSPKNEKLELLYTMARSAKASDDMITAKKYYDMILLEDPLCWEPVFYSVYYTLSDMKNGEIGNKAIEIKNCLNTSLLIVNSMKDDNEKTGALLELQDSVSKAAVILQASSVNFYNSLPGLTRNPLDKIARTIAISELLFAVGNGLKDNGLMANAAAMYKQAIELVETETMLSIPTKNTPPQYQGILNKITEAANFIRLGDPSYTTKREAAANRSKR